MPPKPEKTEDLLLNMRQAGDFLGVTDSRVRQLIAEKKIVSHPAGNLRCNLVSSSELERYVRAENARAEKAATT